MAQSQRNRRSKSSLCDYPTILHSTILRERSKEHHEQISIASLEIPRAKTVRLDYLAPRL